MPERWGDLELGQRAGYARTALHNASREMPDDTVVCVIAASKDPDAEHAIAWDNGTDWARIMINAAVAVNNKRPRENHIDEADVATANVAVAFQEYMAMPEWEQAEFRRLIGLQQEMKSELGQMGEGGPAEGQQEGAGSGQEPPAG